MLKEYRHEEIMKVLNEKKAVTVEELSRKFKVVVITIRRDLDEMAASGLLKRTHGGAIVLNDNVKEIPFEEREVKNAAEKDRIAAKAVEYIKEGETVLIDGGTTNTRVAHAIKEKFEKVKLITVSLKIAMDVSDKLEVYLIGGAVKNISYCTIGTQVLKEIDNIRADKFILAIDGIDPEFGLTTTSINEVAVKSKMITRAKETIVVADSSKFGKAGSFRVAPLSKATVIITGKEAPKNIRNKISKLGVKIIVC